MTNASASTRRVWQWFIAATLVVAAVVGAVLTIAALRSGPVPWADSPATPAMILAQSTKPLPTPKPMTNAPPCRSRDLQLARVWRNGLAGTLIVGVTLRNVGPSACLERGRPSVVALSPDGPEVRATALALRPWGEVANTSARAEVAVAILIPEACAADPGGADQGLPIYQSYVMTLPGGGRIAFASPGVALPCGIEVTPFYTALPAPRYPPDYLARLRPRLVVPASVKAGATLNFIVDLTNPTSRPVPLNPCPIYLEFARPDIKLPFVLNCHSVRAIPAHATVTYRMEMPIPVTMSSGPLRVLWNFAVAGTTPVHATVNVEPPR